eukprot:TRINITY_DN20647_c0_g1_i1.p1 TRINITY_DN20647_c0_g1~~TRINITY_DN20647_c0_g1_i1.p1  ORF type:complete len:105 (-),score=17.87 TRINITY_DN20647_c0_g1_i1:20-334(-)
MDTGGGDGLRGNLQRSNSVVSLSLAPLANESAPSDTESVGGNGSVTRSGGLRRSSSFITLGGVQHRVVYHRSKNDWIGNVAPVSESMGNVMDVMDVMDGWMDGC